MAQESINQEIKWLEEQLEAKKKALLEKGDAKEEKEALKDVIKEVSSQNLLPAPAGVSASDDDDAQKAVLKLNEQEHEAVVAELIAMAF